MRFCGRVEEVLALEFILLALLHLHAMSTNEFDWLPPEVIQELLRIDEDLEVIGCDSSTGSSNSSAAVDASMSLESYSKDPSWLLDGLLSTNEVQFSAYGKAIVASWMQEIANKKNKQMLLAQYNKHCFDAARFFDTSDSKIHPAYILIKVVKKLCQEPNPQDMTKSGEITVYESETLDYIAGYALRRAVSKFGGNPVIDLLSAEPKMNSLIKLLEKRSGSLYCPSEDLSFFIRHVYLKLAVELNKNPRDINVKMFLDTIRKEQYVYNFTDRIKWATSDFNGDLAKDIVMSILECAVKLLSKGFAKNLFQKIRTAHHTTRGLRGDLKRQVNR